MPLDVADCFLWNSPKFISKKTIFPNSLPFLFLFESLARRCIFAHRAKTSKLISVIQLSNILKTKRSGNFKVSQEKLALTAPKTISSSFLENSLNFYVSGAETNRSRFSKLFSPCGLSRRVSFDNSHYQNRHTRIHSGFC
jgi:hypothetical protein